MLKPNETKAHITKPAATILVVDDNPINLKLVSDLLAFEGYRVQKAEDGEQAAARVEAEPPHLILLDVDLPGIRGLTFTSRLKSNVQTAQIITVSLTPFPIQTAPQHAMLP